MWMKLRTAGKEKGRILLEVGRQRETARDGQGSPDVRDLRSEVWASRRCVGYVAPPSDNSQMGSGLTCVIPKSTKFTHTG
jgi:hypothetical protein